MCYVQAVSLNVPIGTEYLDIIVHGRINGCHRQRSELRLIEYTRFWLHCDYLKELKSAIQCLGIKPKVINK